jgi:L-threonylcarbamoyladenylate synthase
MDFQEEINKAVEALKEGKTILYPTDTIWGLGCDASNEEAVKKIYEIKERDKKAFIILIADIGQLRDYVSQIPDVAWDIVDYAEKPLTVIYPKGRKVAENLLSDDGSIAIRLVRDEFCKKLIQKFRKAIVSTSANLSGMPSPGSFKEIDERIIEKADHVVNFKQNEVLNLKPSTIIRLELNGEIKFIRK